MDRDQSNEREDSAEAYECVWCCIVVHMQWQCMRNSAVEELTSQLLTADPFCLSSEALAWTLFVGQGREAMGEW